MHKHKKIKRDIYLEDIKASAYRDRNMEFVILWSGSRIKTIFKKIGQKL